MMKMSNVNPSTGSGLTLSEVEWVKYQMSKLLSKLSSRAPMNIGAWRSQRLLLLRQAQDRNDNVKRGFTLIELLIVMAVMVSVLAIVVGIVTSTLRGTNKTNVINKVRENGNYAVSQMARTIRYAKTIDGVSVSGIPPWDCQVMQPPAPTPTPIQYKFVRINSFDGTGTIFACETNTISSNGQPIIDAGPAGSVSLGACFFTCIKETADSPTIGINFTLTSNTTSTLFESQASIPFTILIKGRN